MKNRIRLLEEYFEPVTLVVRVIESGSVGFLDLYTNMVNSYELK